MAILRSFPAAIDTSGRHADRLREVRGRVGPASPSGSEEGAA